MLKHDQCQAWEEEVARLREENEKLQKENEELKKSVEKTLLGSMKTVKRLEVVMKENEELRKDLLYFWTWIVGGYESRPETGLRKELDKMEERFPWLKGEKK